MCGIIQKQATDPDKFFFRYDSMQIRRENFQILNPLEGEKGKKFF
jgi:hypothetical protein